MVEVEKIKTISELMYELEKAKADAEYWRLTYDKLLRHIEQKDQYISYLESQVHGGKTF